MIEKILCSKIGELKCLHGISNLIETPEVTIEQILYSAVNLIPQAWNFPKLICAQIICYGKKYTTKNFCKTQWQYEKEITVFNQTIGRLEVYYLKQKGKEKSKYFHTDEQELITTIVSQLEKIIKRFYTEKSLRESESCYRTLFDGSADGIAVIDPQSKKIKLANNAMCVFLGYEKNEIIQRNIKYIHHHDAFELLPSLYDLPKNEEKTNIQDVPCRKKNGEIVYADISVNQASMEGKEYIIAFLRDITERKIAEQDRLFLEEQLTQSEKLRVVGQLAGGIAHDFNNMLGAITGYTDLIEEENRDDNNCVLDKRLAQRIETIKKASNRAIDLIAKLLAFSRRGKYRNDTLDIHEIIDDALELLEGTLDKSIFIEKKLTAPHTHIKGDPSQIQNALFNIAINAQDAMPEGGVLLICTDNIMLTKGEYYEELDEGEYLVISISDTGIGMDEQIVKRIFEPFFSTKEVGEGTGLGLASVYGTMKNHGGWITVSSITGVGSTFTIYLPVFNQIDRKITEQNKPKKIIPKGHGTIMVIDDEEMIISIIRDILINSGYEIITFVDGNEAICWYEHNFKKIDLVIVDMIMPIVNGLECYEKMIKVNPGVKAIMISGYTKNLDTRNILAKGIIEFVPKPFDRFTLTKLVNDVVDNKKN